MMPSIWPAVNQREHSVRSTETSKPVKNMPLPHTMTDAAMPRLRELCSSSSFFLFPPGRRGRRKDPGRSIDPALLLGRAVRPRHRGWQAELRPRFVLCGLLPPPLRLLLLLPLSFQRRGCEEAVRRGHSPTQRPSQYRPRVGRQSPEKCRRLRPLLCGPGSARTPGSAPGGGVFCARGPACVSCSSTSPVLVTVLCARKPSFAVSTLGYE